MAEYKVLVECEIADEKFEVGQIVELSAKKAKTMVEEGTLELVEVAPKAEDQVTVTGLYLGQQVNRVYSLQEHGDEYETMAKQFAEKIGGQVL